MNCCENAEKSVNCYFISEAFASDNLSPIQLQDGAQLWMTQLCQSPAPEILFCITVYNEPGSALLYSLAGIKQNLDHLVRAGKRFIAERVTVCLIFDGQENISASALALLKSLKLYTGGQPISEAAIHLFDSKLDLSLVERCIDVDVMNSKLTNNWWDAYQFTLQQDEIIESDFELNADEPLSPRVLLCIKKENAGKLNSHWWFFTILSAYLCPKYCVQMDVGSIPDRNAIDELWQFLEMHPDVGAATGSILVPEPRQFSHFLSLEFRLNASARPIKPTDLRSQKNTLYNEKQKSP